MKSLKLEEMLGESDSDFEEHESVATENVEKYEKKYKTIFSKGGTDDNQLFM